MTMTLTHQPVLLKETIDLLNIKPQEVYLDCTVGSGGHAVEILKKGGKLIGLDVDPLALKRAEKKIKSHCPDSDFKLIKANFSTLSALKKDLGLTNISGILLDLGLSSEQIADQKRGFSFNLSAPLDMRADPDLKVTAADLLNGLTKKELILLFKKLGEEPKSHAIAQAVIDFRSQTPFTLTSQLTQIIRRIKFKNQKINPATRVFQALRMAVNDELNNLKSVLPQAVSFLKPEGRLLVISFHSLEDRTVKMFFKNQKNLKIITKKPITPSAKELKSNLRSRSAKLRAAEKNYE